MKRETKRLLRNVDLWLIAAAVILGPAMIAAIVESIR